MNQSLTSAESVLVTIILATLAIGLPILVVLSIRFLWDRNLNLGRSKELEKLIWQLHRIASAMEHQLNLSFPAVQPGTEDPRDLAYFQKAVAQPKAVAPSMAAPAVAAPSAAAPMAPELTAKEPVTPPAETPQPSAAPAAAQQSPAPLPALQEPSGVAPRAGVNSMFGL